MLKNEVNTRNKKDEGRSDAMDSAAVIFLSSPRHQSSPMTHAIHNFLCVQLPPLSRASVLRFLVRGSFTMVGR
jgi:hypothetical protein